MSPYRALLPFLFGHERYLQMAIGHGMAVNLESRDLLEAFKNGAYPKEGWEIKALENAQKGARSVRYAIRSSFLMVAAASVVAVSIAYCFGRVGTELPLSWAKTFGLVGGFLAAWATLMELGGFIRTYSGEALHELVHPAFFKVLFVPGTLAAMVGMLL